jgi:NADH-quinone oxidoreductase subunit A
MAGIPQAYLPVLLMTGIGVLVVTVAIALNRFITPSRPSREKLTAYECGEEPVGGGRGPVDIQYYLYVLVFLILDIEAAFLIPFVVDFASLNLKAIATIAVFVFLLLDGWLYAIKKGALEWQGS